MLIITDILRAALCCAAGEKEERTYLQGVRITPTHIQACNGVAMVSMEHGDNTDIDGVFLLKGDIPDHAEGTYINLLKDGWMAIHVDEFEKAVGSSTLTKIECRYPDIEKLLPPEPERCDEFPMFSSTLLDLPYRMFGSVALKFKPFGKSAPCQVLLDPVINKFFGNPVLVLMPLREDAFEQIAGVINEN